MPAAGVAFSSREMFVRPETLTRDDSKTLPPDVIPDTDSRVRGAIGHRPGKGDNPGQFREPPLSGIFRHAWRERFGHRDPVDYMHVPF
jgi:hypothetical protein